MDKLVVDKLGKLYRLPQEYNLLSGEQQIEVGSIIEFDVLEVQHEVVNMTPSDILLQQTGKLGTGHVVFWETITDWMVVFKTLGGRLKSTAPIKKPSTLCDCGAKHTSFPTFHAGWCSTNGGAHAQK